MRRIFWITVLLVACIAMPVYAFSGKVFAYSAKYEYHTDYITVHLDIEETRVEDGKVIPTKLFDIDLNVPKEDLSKETKK